MRSRRRPHWYIPLLLGADVTALLLAIGVATYIRFGLNVVDWEWPFIPDLYLKATAALTGLLLVLFWLHGLYSWDNLLGGVREYTRTANSCTYGIVGTMLFSFALGGLPVISRFWLVAFWILSILFVCLGRFACRRAVYALRRRGQFIARVLIAGASRHSTAIARQLCESRQSGFDIAGFLDDYLPVGAEVEPGLRVLGRPQQAARVMAQSGARELIVVPSALAWDSQRELLELAASNDHNVTVHVAPGFYDLVAFGVRPTIIANVPLASLDRNWISGLDGALKVLLDYLVAVPLLLVLGPPTLLLTLARRRRVGRPIEQWPIFGQHGRVLNLRAFDQSISSSLLIRGVPSLPLVLTRKLSLVGPRPIEARPGRGVHGHRALLLSVKPGLTGPWRLVDGDDVATAAAADAFYVRNYSIWLDLQVLFQTARRLLISPLRRTERTDRARVRRWGAYPVRTSGDTGSSNPV
jgi:lipopolysaccharide/colanic/teichoic acid biosynthesis glycosyltransferase